MPGSRAAMIIERAPLPIVEVQGSAHRVSHVNSAFCRLLGKSREDLIGKSFADIVHGGDQCIPILDRIYQTGEAVTHAHEDDSDPASTLWLYAMWPTLDANEQPVGVIIQLAKTANLLQHTVAVNEALLIAGLRQHELTEDAVKLNEQLQAEIAERRQTEEKLRGSEERFRVAALAVSNLIWTNNAEGMMEGEQPGWAQFTGQTLEEYQGYGWAQAVHPDDAHPTIHAWNAAVAEKRLFEFEHRVRRHDGAWRSCSIRAVPVIGGDGEIREWVGVHNDITERKHSDEALRLAMVEIERASRAKDDFLAALSHELRTPLTPVLMTAAALETDPSLSEDVRHQLSMMRRNIELEARLIDDLLDLTHIIRGKLSIAPVASDIHLLLEHTHEIIHSDGLGKQVQIVLRLGARRHHALVDPTRIQQVFWNLLKNAVKFTPSGGSISIIVSTTNDADDRIVISVQDNGLGMSAETLPHIFNAFEQGAIAAQHRFGGLGLGLAISQAIITGHDGVIRGESKGLNCGSTFTVVLPTIDAPAASASAREPSELPTRTLKLLIVEDHEATRQVLQRLLTIKGHQVTTAGSVQEALTIHRAERFDAVISDLGLPDGSGLDLMQQLQRQRPVPAIALSGYGMEDDLRRTKEAGFFAHLVKPVNLDQLRQLIDQITPSPP